MAALIYNIGTQNLYGNGFIWTISPVTLGIDIVNMFISFMFM